ncbi:MAG: response regulator transcription factor [Bdellovibrionaceae bacterium]|nr:response regulator transcription factor [Pseudobdellovibrionaceae bacterium]
MLIAMNALCLIVEDQIESRKLLVDLVRRTFPALTIETVGSARDALSWIASRAAQPQGPSLKLALVDLGLPDGSGVDLIRALSEKEPHAVSIVVTIYDDDNYLFDALAAGAGGYLLKGGDPQLLSETLRRLDQGEPPLSPSIARRLVAHFRTPVETRATEPHTGAELSPRERETLTLLGRGLTVSESAREMGLSPQTVAGYVKVIYQKLHVSNRAAAIRVGIRRGLV